MIKYCALLLLPITSVAIAQPPTVGDTATDDGLRYSVKPGDTLYGLADKYLSHLGDYAALQKSLKLKEARHLQPGTTVILPRSLLKYTPANAQLVAFRGAVAVNNAVAAVGMILREGAQITTSSGASASFLLSNGSKVSLPSQSNVRLARLRKLVIDGSLDYVIAVDDGRMETRATHFTDPNSRFQIRTPYATSAVRGTEFRVAFSKAGVTDSLTEVLDGAVAVGAPKDFTPKIFPKAVGVAVTTTGSARSEALLPAPKVLNLAEIQHDDLVHFAVSPIDTAVGYHIQIAKDAGFVDVLDDLHSKAPQADFAHVPNGNQFVRVSALSATGFEGLADTSAFVRKLNSIHAIVEPGGHGGFRFKWFGSGGDTARYRFQITTAPGATPLIDEPGLSERALELTHLAPGVYYWRVSATIVDQGESSTAWTDFSKLTIVAN